MEHRDEGFDQTDVIDAALRDYAEIEIPAGLETRVLARTAEARDRKRLILFPRVWIQGAGLAVAAALLVAVALLPALHRRDAHHEPSPTLAAIRTRRPSAKMARAAPAEPRVARTDRQVRRVREVEEKRAARILSKPFAILPPSPQERILLTLNNAQRRAIVEMRAANPTEVQPVEIGPISIAEITTKPLTDSGAQE